MRVFLTKPFARFTKRERIRDENLRALARDMEAGSFDADLGGGLFKQRIARQGQGKSGGYRALIAFRRGSLLVFLTGFAKSEISNLAPQELNALKKFARHVVGLDSSEIEAMQNESEWVELADEET